MPTVVITGANRGIGLEFARQYAADGWRVIATCRSPEKAPAELTGADGVEVRGLDVADFAGVEAFGKAVADTPVDLFINNAGVYGKRGAQAFGAIDADAWMEVLKVNTIAPVKMVEALLPALQKADGAKIAILSSKVGSVADNGSGGNYAYRTSKAAVNMVGKNLALELGDIPVLLLHPGWVRTDMGGPNGLIDTAESVSGLRKVIGDAGPDQSGHFYDYAGKEIPW
ncbi:Short chain dehydrogenase [Caenispirillum salinarum AK4]|uniref:Short chain dehydrogenase n=1 Tax=Caenispirillum salinarum AK4 TaxID=1238182 RepID=K9H2C0_9PROT|nr:SDR family oxidoreductase [Caenispirillum salinarum]EKV31707.1 Short chain dehydrogenase [Caenispirillum salinarum AK4]